MATYLSALGRGISSYLPQNAHARELQAIDSQQRDLQAALTNKPGQTFQKIMEDTSAQLQSEKEKCSNALQRMNGSFYQDPKSSLKQAWDSIVAKIKLVLGFDVTDRSQLANLPAQLSSLTPSADVKAAQEAITRYEVLEKKRDGIQEQLTKIISSQKTGPQATLIQASLLREKRDLQIRQNELCGNYYQDPSSLLDQAWKSYQKAADVSSADAPTLLSTYQKLDDERKSNETKFSGVEFQFSIPASADRTIEVLSTESISAQLIALESTKRTESNLVGVDWKGTALQAAKIALITAGYIFLNATAL